MDRLATLRLVARDAAADRVRCAGVRMPPPPPPMPLRTRLFARASKRLTRRRQQALDCCKSAHLLSQTGSHSQSDQVTRPARRPTPSSGLTFAARCPRTGARFLGKWPPPTSPWRHRRRRRLALHWSAPEWRPIAGGHYWRRPPERIPAARPNSIKSRNLTRPKHSVSRGRAPGRRGPQDIRPVRAGAR